MPAWSYNLTQDFINGFYWASLPVEFIINESNPTRKAMLEELAETAIKQWESKTGVDLWSLNGSGSKNIIRWSTKFAAETQMDPSSVLAVAIRYTDGPYYARSEIVINGNHAAFNTGMTSMDRMNVATTLVHEFGHTIGLDHSENEEAVMAPRLQYPYTGLHWDDIYGMQDAYNKTEQRQITRYVSPLAYAKGTSSSQALSCGTVSTGATGQNTFLSLGLGMLIGLVRKIASWFKSLF